jgi:glycosyltransferase involved in cell wall biosynthesis
MKNLVWQFHIDLNRAKYDGQMRKQMTYCSMATVAQYAAKYGAEYELCTKSKWHSRGIRGGPAMDRFQLIEEKYDEFDYILYLDTDILIHPDAVNLFLAVPDGTEIAADNWVHKYDRDLLEVGWLKSVNKDRYNNSAIQGGIILMSRDFRKWLRDNCNPEEVDCDKGLSLPKDKETIKWPVYDQSLMSYYIYSSPFNLFNINKKDILNRNLIVHMHGNKTIEQQVKYFSKYSEFSAAWSCSLINDTHIYMGDTNE